MKHYMIQPDGAIVETEDVLEWARWLEKHHRDRKVAQTDSLRPPPGWQVSTVFLGLEHGHDSEGKPLLWETMVFGGPLDEECERYSSVEAARVGHDAMVERCKVASNLN